MKYTPSGALSVGSPNSLARFNEEATRAMEVDFNLLTLTDEGMSILDRAARFTGCNLPQMLEYEKTNTGHLATWINHHATTINAICAGIRFAFTKL